MATTQLSKVTVEELTKFGLKSNGEYINWSKNLDDKAKIPVVPGRTFNMELYIADSGKKYVNKVLQMVETADVPKVDTSRAKRYSPKVEKETFSAEQPKGAHTIVDKPMTREDWNNKDRSQLIGGLSHDAATLVAAMLSMTPDVSTDIVVELFESVLKGLLKVRDGLK